MKVGYILE